MRMQYVAIAGPTASGKTAVAMALAQHFPVEIVSVDSALVYRGMDIGTAKPSAQEQHAVAHHLIDIRDPLQAYSAAEFAADATRLVAEICARGKLPLLVGGTMLYFKALFEGLDAIPASDPAIRTQLQAHALQQGWPAMHAHLARVDPVTAARLAPNDAQRIGRALEVFYTSGQTMAFFQRQKNAAQPSMTGGNTPALLICLEPQERSWLHARIAQRFDAMLAAGFLQEMQQLRARGDLSLGLASMRCVGYRQAWELWDAYAVTHHTFLAESVWPKPLVEKLRMNVAAATRQLAKRQLTWLRAMPAKHVVACDAPGILAQAHSLVRALVVGSE